MELSFGNAVHILTLKVQGWVKGFIVSLPNLIAAVAIALAFYYISKAVRLGVTRFLVRISHSAAIARLMASVLQSATIIAGLFIALGVLNLDKTVTSLLAGAGLAGLAIGFAFQEIASNFIAGILIAFRKPYQEGDLVRVDQHEGKISAIDLRTTRILSYDGLEVIVPNKDMFTKIIVNLTSTDPRRVDVEIGVSYSDDLERVRTVAIDAVRDIEDRLEDREPELFFSEFGDSSIQFELRLWVSKSDQITFLKTRNAMVMKIKSAFDREKITIPFPIRALDFQQQGALASTSSPASTQ